VRWLQRGPEEIAELLNAHLAKLLHLHPLRAFDEVDGEERLAAKAPKHQKQAVRDQLNAPRSESLWLDGLSNRGLCPPRLARAAAELRASCACRQS
jgi:hypothetical protein